MFSLLKPHVLVLTGLLVSATAIAEDHKFYVQFNAGAVFAPSFTDSNQFFVCSFPTCGPLTTTFKENYDTGFAGSVALGYQIAEQFRLEGEAIYQSNDRDKFHVTQTVFSNTFSASGALKGERERTAFLLNGYYDFKNSTAFTPYITAGLGGYHLRLKGTNVENDLDFAWQTGAGVNYKLDERISFDLKYRYFGGTDVDVRSQSPSGVITTSQLYEVGDHQVMAGIRVGF